MVFKTWEKRIVPRVLAVFSAMILLLGCVTVKPLNREPAAETEPPAEEKGVWRMAKEIHYDKEGKISNWSETQYDANGNDIKQTYYSADGSVIWWMESFFDENNNRISAVSYNKDGSIAYLTEYAYDEAGNILKYKVTYGDGSVYEWTEYEWTYCEPDKENKENKE